MSWKEFLNSEQWQIEALYEAVENKHDQKAHERASMMALIANCHKGPKQKAYKAEQFLAKKKSKAPKTPDADELMSKFIAMNAAFGGEEIKE